MRSIVPLVAGLAFFGTAAIAQPIRIGVLNDRNSVYADVSGQVLGRSVEVPAADHQNQAGLGSAIARRWYDTRRARVPAAGAERLHETMVDTTPGSANLLRSR